MEHDTVLTALEQKYASLTKAQKLVADYIIKNPLNASFFTVDQLASTTGTSTATVVRLAVTMNFSGYAEFQCALQDCLQKKMAPSHRLEERFGHLKQPNHLISDIFMSQMELLQETFGDLNEADLLKAVTGIITAKNVYVIGSRSCYSVAHYLAYNVNRILGNCRFLNPADGDFSDELNRICAGDVLISFSLPRYIRSVVNATKVAKERGVYIISITDSYRSPIAEFSDIFLRVSYKSYDFHNTIMPALMLSELIISLITADSPMRTKQNLARLEETLAQMDIHIN